MQAGRHFWLPLVRLWLSIYSLRCPGCFRSPDPRPYWWLLHHHRGVRGLSALIDDTGLFIDGRIADLVTGETISISTAAGISLCIDKCRFFVPNPEPSYPAVSPPILSITTGALSSAAPPAYSNIASGRPLDSSQPSSAYPAGPDIPPRSKLAGMVRPNAGNGRPVQAPPGPPPSPQLTITAAPEPEAGTAAACATEPRAQRSPA